MRALKGIRAEGNKVKARFNTLIYPEELVREKLKKFKVLKEERAGFYIVVEVEASEEEVLSIYEELLGELI